MSLKRAGPPLGSWPRRVLAAQDNLFVLRLKHKYVSLGGEGPGLLPPLPPLTPTLCCGPPTQSVRTGWLAHIIRWGSRGGVSGKYVFMFVAWCGWKSVSLLSPLTLCTRSAGFFLFGLAPLNRSSSDLVGPAMVDPLPPALLAGGRSRLEDNSLQAHLPD